MDGWILEHWIPLFQQLLWDEDKGKACFKKKIKYVINNKIGMEKMGFCHFVDFSSMKMSSSVKTLSSIYVLQFNTS